MADVKDTSVEAGDNQPGPERPGGHDERRAGGHSSYPGQTRQRHGANLIPQRRLCSWQTRPTGGREAPPRVWSLTSATEGFAGVSAVAGGLSDRELKAATPAPCPGDPHNCKLLLSSQEAYHGRCAQAEISRHQAICHGPHRRQPPDRPAGARESSPGSPAHVGGNRRQDPQRPRLRLPRTVPPARQGPHQQAAKFRPSHLHRRPARTLLVTTALLYGRHHKGMPRWPLSSTGQLLLFSESAPSTTSVSAPPDPHPPGAGCARYPRRMLVLWQGRLALFGVAGVLWRRVTGRCCGCGWSGAGSADR